MNTNHSHEFLISLHNFPRLFHSDVSLDPLQTVSGRAIFPRHLVRDTGASLSYVYFSVLRILLERYKGLDCDPILDQCTFRQWLGLNSSLPCEGSPSVGKLHISVQENSASSVLLPQSVSWLRLTLKPTPESEQVDLCWECNYSGSAPLGALSSIAKRFTGLLNNLIQNPDVVLAAVPLLDGPELSRMLVDRNRTETVFPSEATVHKLFQEQALLHPARIAVAEGSREVTYGEMEAGAILIAQRLQDSGAGPGTIVALALDRSASLFMAMLAVLKTGACYLPVDARSPSEWLKVVGSDARPVAVVTDELHRRDVSCIGGAIVSLDDANETARDSHSNWTEIPVSSSDPAYLIYTSGSTGVPKGVHVNHRGIVRLVRNTNYVDLQPSDRVAQLANATFDAITFEVWGALINGGRVVVIPSDALLVPETLAATIRKECITVMFLTTALFNLVARLKPDAFAPLRVVLMGGEAATPVYQRRVLEAGPPRHLLHVYGPTECTTFSLWRPIREVLPDATSIPLGRPLANMQAYVLDRSLQPVPDGVEGELFLGGEGLAIGYFHRAELTAEKFVPMPASLQIAAYRTSRLYKTGDRVRYCENGEIEFLGRTDNQVKLRGFRIELEEIEAVLQSYPEIAEAVVVLRTGDRGVQQLGAYATTNGSTPVSETQVKRFLQTKLPAHMIPNTICFMDRLPLNASGKIDRNALYPVPVAASPETLPISELQHQIAKIWQGILLRDGLGLDENFFDLGATSLDLAEAHARLEERFHAGLRVTDLFRHSNIRMLAHKIDNGVKQAPAALEAPTRASRQIAALAKGKSANQRNMLVARAAAGGGSNSHG